MSVCVEILIVGDLTVESALVPSLLKKMALVEVVKASHAGY